jgi:hypothetical protein
MARVHTQRAVNIVDEKVSSGSGAVGSCVQKSK